MIKWKTILSTLAFNLTETCIIILLRSLTKTRIKIHHYHNADFYD